MKRSFCLLLCSLISPLLWSQNELDRHIEFGVDLSCIIIRAAGGDRPYWELDLVYRESQGGKDLRFRLNVNKYNWFGFQTVDQKLVEDKQPVSVSYFQTEYFPKVSYLAGIGLTKYLQNNDLPVYYGIDGNFGIGRGGTVTSRRTVMLESEEISIVDSRSANLAIVGLSPVLGLKKAFSDKLLLGIEFSIPVNLVLGKLDYQNEAGELFTRSANRLDFRMDKLLNDIVILVRF
ncbi:hypothetical protein [Flavilitoribacter nigricans]|nr:hypothetical protein [Flavilitoribacter nigricans]